MSQIGLPKMLIAKEPALIDLLVVFLFGAKNVVLQFYKKLKIEFLREKVTLFFTNILESI